MKNNKKNRFIWNERFTSKKTSKTVAQIAQEDQERKYIQKMIRTIDEREKCLKRAK